MPWSKNGIWFRLIHWESISLMVLSKSLSGLWYGSIPLRSHNLLVGGLEHGWIMTFHSVGNHHPN